MACKNNNSATNRLTLVAYYCCFLGIGSLPQDARGFFLQVPPNSLVTRDNDHHRLRVTNKHEKSFFSRRIGDNHNENGDDFLTNEFLNTDPSDILDDDDVPPKRSMSKRGWGEEDADDSEEKPPRRQRQQQRGVRTTPNSSGSIFLDQKSSSSGEEEVLAPRRTNSHRPRSAFPQSILIGSQGEIKNRKEGIRPKTPTMAKSSKHPPQQEPTQLQQSPSKKAQQAQERMETKLQNKKDRPTIITDKQIGSPSERASAATRNNPKQAPKSEDDSLARPAPNKAARNRELSIYLSDQQIDDETEEEGEEEESHLSKADKDTNDVKEASIHGPDILGGERQRPSLSSSSEDYLYEEEINEKNLNRRTSAERKKPKSKVSNDMTTISLGEDQPQSAGTTLREEETGHSPSMLHNNEGEEGNDLPLQEEEIDEPSIPIAFVSGDNLKLDGPGEQPGTPPDINEPSPQENMPFLTIARQKEKMDSLNGPDKIDRFMGQQQQQQTKVDNPFREENFQRWKQPAANKRGKAEAYRPKDPVNSQRWQQIDKFREDPTQFEVRHQNRKRRENPPLLDSQPDRLNKFVHHPRGSEGAQEAVRSTKTPINSLQEQWQQRSSPGSEAGHLNTPLDRFVRDPLHSDASQADRFNKDPGSFEIYQRSPQKPTRKVAPGSAGLQPDMLDRFMEGPAHADALQAQRYRDDPSRFAIYQQQQQPTQEMPALSDSRAERFREGPVYRQQHPPMRKGEVSTTSKREDTTFQEHHADPVSSQAERFSDDSHTSNQENMLIKDGVPDTQGRFLADPSDSDASQAERFREDPVYGKQPPKGKKAHIASKDEESDTLGRFLADPLEPDASQAERFSEDPVYQKQSPKSKKANIASEEGEPDPVGHLLEDPTEPDTSQADRLREDPGHQQQSPKRKQVDIKARDGGPDNVGRFLADPSDPDASQADRFVEDPRFGRLQEQVDKYEEDPNSFEVWHRPATSAAQDARISPEQQQQQQRNLDTAKRPKLDIVNRLGGRDPNFQQWRQVDRFKEDPSKFELWKRPSASLTDLDDNLSSPTPGQSGDWPLRKQDPNYQQRQQIERFEMDPAQFELWKHPSLPEEERDTEASPDPTEDQGENSFLNTLGNLEQKRQVDRFRQDPSNFQQRQGGDQSSFACHADQDDSFIWDPRGLRASQDDGLSEDQDRQGPSQFQRWERPKENPEQASQSSASLEDIYGLQSRRLQRWRRGQDTAVSASQPDQSNGFIDNPYGAQPLRNTRYVPPQDRLVQFQQPSPTSYDETYEENHGAYEDEEAIHDVFEDKPIHEVFEDDDEVSRDAFGEDEASHDAYDCDHYDNDASGDSYEDDPAEAMTKNTARSEGTKQAKTMKASQVAKDSDARPKAELVSEGLKSTTKTASRKKDLLETAAVLQSPDSKPNHKLKDVSKKQPRKTPGLGIPTSKDTSKSKIEATKKRPSRSKFQDDSDAQSSDEILSPKSSVGTPPGKNVTKPNNKTLAKKQALSASNNGEDSDALEEISSSDNMLSPESSQGTPPKKGMAKSKEEIDSKKTPLSTSIAEDISDTIGVMSSSDGWFSPESSLKIPTGDESATLNQETQANEEPFATSTAGDEKNGLETETILDEPLSPEERRPADDTNESEDDLEAVFERRIGDESGSHVVDNKTQENTFTDELLVQEGGLKPNEQKELERLFEEASLDALMETPYFVSPGTSEETGDNDDDLLPSEPECHDDQWDPEYDDEDPPVTVSDRWDEEEQFMGDYYGEEFDENMPEGYYSYHDYPWEITDPGGALSPSYFWAEDHTDVDPQSRSDRRWDEMRRAEAVPTPTRGHPMTFGPLLPTAELGLEIPEDYFALQKSEGETEKKMKKEDSRGKGRPKNQGKQKKKGMRKGKPKKKGRDAEAKKRSSKK